MTNLNFSFVFIHIICIIICIIVITYSYFTIKARLSIKHILYGVDLLNYKTLHKLLLKYGWDYQQIKYSYPKAGDTIRKEYFDALYQSNITIVVLPNTNNPSSPYFKIIIRNSNNDHIQQFEFYYDFFEFVKYIILNKNFERAKEIISKT